MRDAAQQPDELARLRRRVAELEAQLADAQGQAAPLAAVEGVPAVLVHAVASAPQDGQVVRLERGVIAVVGPGGSPCEVWDAVTAAAVPADPGPARPAAAGSPGAVRVFARRLPAGLLALSVPDGSDGRDLILSAALPPGHRRRALRMAHRASRLRPAAVAAAVAVRFAGRAVSVSRAHAGHAVIAGASLTAAAAGAAFVLTPATSPAPSLAPAPPPAATAHHHGRAHRFHQPPATLRRRRTGTAADEPSPSPLPPGIPSPSPSGLVPSVLAPVTSPVTSILRTPLVSVSASPSSSGNAGGVCAGVLILGVCVSL